MLYDPYEAYTITEAMNEVICKAPQVLIIDWDLGECKSSVDAAPFALEQRTNWKVICCSGNRMSTLR